LHDPFFHRSRSIRIWGGVSSAADDLALTFEDWTPDVETIPQKITVLHRLLQMNFDPGFLRNSCAVYHENKHPAG